MDLPIQQQVVQSNHASMECGHAFEKKGKDPASLIVLQVKNKAQLEKALAKTKAAGIRTEVFHEPDWDYGFTAFATEQISEDQRKLFKNYRLWTLRDA